MNNLQANSLSAVSSKYKKKLITEPISLDKKSFQNLSVGSYLKLNKNILNAKVIQEKDILADTEVTVQSGYVFFKTKMIKTEKFKNRNFKNRFYLESDFFDFLEDGKYVFTKVPLDMLLFIDGNKYAKIELYFDDYFYIKIKELF